MWQPIGTAPKSDYIVVGTQYARSKWLVNYAFWDDAMAEWVDVHSDRVLFPHVWAPQPPDQSMEAMAAAGKRFD
jgi:hypothetical protein